MKQNVIIEQNNICFNRNMLMLGCVTWPSWQRLALCLSKSLEEGIFWQAVKCQGCAFANLDHRLLSNTILYGTCIKQWVWFKWLSLPPSLTVGSQGWSGVSTLVESSSYRTSLCKDLCLPRFWIKPHWLQLSRRKRNVHSSGLMPIVLLQDPPHWAVQTSCGARVSA